MALGIPLGERGYLAGGSVLLECPPKRGSDLALERIPHGKHGAPGVENLAADARADGDLTALLP